MCSDGCSAYNRNRKNMRTEVDSSAARSSTSKRALCSMRSCFMRSERRELGTCRMHAWTHGILSNGVSFVLRCQRHIVSLFPR
jgi:hypothetical protein